MLYHQSAPKINPTGGFNGVVDRVQRGEDLTLAVINMCQSRQCIKYSGDEDISPNCKAKMKTEDLGNHVGRPELGRQSEKPLGTLHS